MAKADHGIKAMNTRKTKARGANLTERDQAILTAIDIYPRSRWTSACPTLTATAWQEKSLRMEHGWTMQQ